MTTTNSTLASIALEGTPHTVTLRRSGQHVFIRPLIEGLDRHLFTVLHRPLDHPVDGYRVCPLAEQMVWPAGDGSVQSTLAGLEPLLIEVLQQFGHTVRLTGDRPGELARPDTSALARFDAVDASVLGMVRRHDRGLIRYDASQVQPARLIAQIYHAWPRLSIVVTATRVEDVRRLRAGLAKLGVQATYLTSRRYESHTGRLTIATYSCLGAGPVGIERRNIYIALNPVELFSGFMGYGVEGIKAAWSARCYGLLPLNSSLAPRDRDYLTALFGMEQATVPRHGFLPIDVHVVFSRIAGGPSLPRNLDVVALKRLGIWQHPLRNRRLARLAELLAAGNSEDLARTLPALAGMPWDHPRVGVLVEDMEHARQLAKHLSGWGDGRSRPLYQFPEDRVVVRDRGGHALVTFAGLPEAGPFDVIVRADAGVGLPPMPATQWEVPQSSNRRLLLVDTNDRHHPVLRQRTEQRRQAYRAAGFHILGGEQPTALQQYCNSRPEALR